MSNTVILTVVILTALAVLLALVLFWVSKKFKVEEDPRIDEVEKVMPGANCGGCGFAGCRAFAEAAVKASNLDSQFCPVGGNETMKKVAAILGYEVKEKAPQVAVVRCNGSCENRPRTNIYDGSMSCKVKAALYAGDTGCSYGCVGCGDCVAACQFGAISMDPATGLPVVDETRCTACGACAKACPKGVIEIRNMGTTARNRRRVYVSCINKDKGGVARKACSAACIGCGKCAKVCKFGAITIENNLSYIDFTKCVACGQCVLECPTGAIHAVNFTPKKVEPAPVKAAVPAKDPAPVKAAAPAKTAVPAKAAAQAEPAAAPSGKEKPVKPVKKEAVNE